MTIKYKNGELRRCDWDISLNGKDYYEYVWGPDFDYINKAPEEYRDALYNNYKYYICPRDVPEGEITENLIEVSRGEVGVRWDIAIMENMRTHVKWDERRFIHNVRFEIHRNDRLFMEGFAGSLESAYRQAQTLINKYKGHSVELETIDFDKKMVGRRIFYRDEPAIIQSFVWGEGSVWIVPDKDAGCERFSEPKRCSHDTSLPSFWYEYENGLQVPLTSDEIWWWRK